MDLVQICGWLGSALVMVNYIALTRGWIEGKGLAYQWLVLAISLTYGYMNWKLGAYPVVGINAIFGCLATSILLRRYALRSPH